MKEMISTVIDGKTINGYAYNERQLKMMFRVWLKEYHNIDCTDAQSIIDEEVPLNIEEKDIPTLTQTTIYK